MGDGDCVAIGGNHLIHAARRNIDVTALVFNNSIYGMTGSQIRPRPPSRATARPPRVYGNVEQAFDICELAHAAGATYVARGTPYAYTRLSQLIAGGIAHKGFRLRRGDGLVPDLLRPPERHPRPVRHDEAASSTRAVPVDKFDRDGPRLHDRYPVGVLRHVERREYTAAYAEVVQRAPRRAPVAEPRPKRGRRDRSATRSASRARAARGSSWRPPCWPTPRWPAAARSSPPRATAPRLAAAPRRPRSSSPTRRSTIPR